MMMKRRLFEVETVYFTVKMAVYLLSSYSVTRKIATK
jgi:hypothetical protein